MENSSKKNKMWLLFYVIVMFVMAGLFILDVLPSRFADEPEWLSYLVGTVWLVGAIIVSALSHVRDR